ncbi:MAG: hypothetical protein ACRC5A_14165 [Enterobacteriaceae bacterium]
MLSFTPVEIIFIVGWIILLRIGPVLLLLPILLTLLLKRKGDANIPRPTFAAKIKSVLCIEIPVLIITVATLFYLFGAIKLNQYAIKPYLVSLLIFVPVTWSIFFIRRSSKINKKGLLISSWGLFLLFYIPFTYTHVVEKKSREHTQAVWNALKKGDTAALDKLLDNGCPAEEYSGQHNLFQVLNYMRLQPQFPKASFEYLLKCTNISDNSSVHNGSFITYQQEALAEPKTVNTHLINLILNHM